MCLNDKIFGRGAGRVKYSGSGLKKCYKWEGGNNSNSTINASINHKVLLCNETRSIFTAKIIINFFFFFFFFFLIFKLRG